MGERPTEISGSVPVTPSRRTRRVPPGVPSVTMIAPPLYAPRSTPSRPRYPPLTGVPPIGFEGPTPTIPRFPAVNPAPVLQSPRDTTNIEVNGQVIDRESIPSISLPTETIQPAPPTEEVPPPERTEPTPPSTPPTPDPEIPNSESSKNPKVPPASESSPAEVPQTPPPKPRGLLDYDSMTPEEQAAHRTDFRVKFGILAEHFTNYGVPRELDSLTLYEIEAMYERYVRQIYIHRSRDKYKVFLLIGCAGMEWFLTKILGLNATGFTLSQIQALSTYDQLLIKLGERNYCAVESEWSLEVQILFMMGLNAVIFVIANTFAGSLGGGVAPVLMQAISSLLSGDVNILPPPPPQGPGHPPTPAPATPVGPTPIPQPTGFGGLDPVALIGGLIRSIQQQPAPAATQQTIPTQSTPAPQSPSSAAPRRPPYAD